MEKGYNMKQVSELLGIKVRTVRSWARSGKIKAVKYIIKLENKNQ